jgi:hypothetical protein
MTLHRLGLLLSRALIADKELTVFLAAKYSHCHSTALLSVILRENCSFSMFEGRDGQPFVLFSERFRKVSLHLDVVPAIQQ